MRRSVPRLAGVPVNTVGRRAVTSRVALRAPAAHTFTIPEGDAPSLCRHVARLRDPRQQRWTERATVVGLSGPRSYTVGGEGGRVMRRNRRHLQATQEVYQPELPSQPVNQEAGVPAPQLTTAQPGVEAGVPVLETPRRQPDQEAGLPAPVSATPERRRSERVLKAPIRLDL